jgi:prophage antirepressor-like protein
MKDSFSRTLEFNGKNITVIHNEGKWWVAIKPICDALEVEYTRTFKNLKEDEILGQLLAEQPMVASDGRTREMLCLPEKFIYGWLFSIRSESPALKKYKLVCYDILYNHFHGALTGRIETLTERVDLDMQIIDLQDQLLQSEQFLKIQELKKRKTQLGKRLRELDAELVSGQTTIAPLN